MPSAKSIRVSMRKRDRNLPLRSRAKTYIRQARGAMASGDLERAERETRSAVVAPGQGGVQGGRCIRTTRRGASRG